MTGQVHNSWSRNACVWACAFLVPLGITGCGPGTPRQVSPDRAVAHGKPVLGIAVDLSGSTRQLEAGEKQNVDALVDWAMGAKAEVVLTAIGTTSAAHDQPLASVDFDVNDGGNRFTRASKQKPLRAQFDRALDRAFDLPRGGSDIMGAIVVEGQALAGAVGTRPTILAVISDGWNFGDDRQLRFTDATLTEPAATLVHRAQQDGLVPDLSGMTAIYFGGGGQASDNSHPSTEVQLLRRFWLAYFAAAKGPVPQYAAVLSLPK